MLNVIARVITSRDARSLTGSFLQSIVMVVFRDDKSVADEFKAWQFWHIRQHSPKQRILDIGEGEMQIQVPVLH